MNSVPLQLRRSGGQTMIMFLVFVLVAALLPILAASPAGADHDPGHTTGTTDGVLDPNLGPTQVTFTLEGCRGENFPAGYPLEALNFLCDQDYPNPGDTVDAYTTGNEGKTWNELDLVPKRLTADNGNGDQTYELIIAADHEKDGTIGYDLITEPALNTDLSVAAAGFTLAESCVLDPGTQEIADIGVGGADNSIFRVLTITQKAGAICVWDYQQRLAGPLKASLYSGSSLQSNLLAIGVGEKRVSIPTGEISPQELTKDMSATQGADFMWNLTKGATPAEYDFGCTCEPGNEDPSTEVTVRIDWEKVEVAGDLKIITNIYATNPSKRTITYEVSDEIFDALNASQGTAGPVSVDVPPNVAGYLVATFEFDISDGVDHIGETWSNTATADLFDVIFPDISLGQLVASSDTVVQAGTQTNATAVITDVESISGAAGKLSYSVDAVAGATGAFQGGYVLGTPTQADVTWVSDAQDADGFVEFTKTVYLDGPAIVTDGKLSDVASLEASDGFVADDAMAMTTFTSDAEVALTINKTITGGVLADGQSETFLFDVFDGPDLVAGDVEVTITGPATSGSATVEGLEPGVEYTVSEQDKDYWTEEGDKTITINLPACEDSLTFANTFAPDLDVTKDANASYTERHDWDVEKTVDPESQDEFAGNAVGWTWTIDIIETVVDQDFLVTGTIDVFNPMPYQVTATVSDELDDGTPVSVDCPGNSVTVAPLTTESCSYSASPDDATATLNTATATTFGIDFTGTAVVAYDVNVENDSATVSDTEVGLTDEPVSGGDQFNFTDGDVCSSDQADYGEDGMYMVTIPNTATLVDAEGTIYTDGATTKYTCYAPLVTKDASASYTERHDWDVEKTVDPLSQMGLPGDTLPWTWTINVTETVVDQDFEVTGTINVSNPAGAPDSITVSVADALSDGTIADVDCDGFGATSVTVAPGATESCSYTANPGDASATSNTATGTFNGIDFTGSADVTFVTNVENDSATVSDIEIGLVDEDARNAPFTGNDSVTCSTDRAVYAALGDGFMYMDTVPNTATLTDAEGTVYQDDAITEWLCKAGFVDIVKTTNGEVRSDLDIKFGLYSGETLLEELTTLGDADGKLEFQTALRPGDTYTICEGPVPSGFTFEVTPMPADIYPGPPGAENPTGEVQCFDFTAPEKAISTFTVENSFPGGGPRTPGYWMNWSTCTGGNQAETAAKLGGTAEGVYILDDLLPKTVGNLTVDTCEIGVLVLDARKQTKGNKKMANDAAYDLARSYLAAQLNQMAGACDPLDTDTFDVAGVGDGLTFEQVLAAAQQLLVDVGYDGTGSYLGPKDKSGDRQIALALNGIIDDYNNGEICDGEPSH